MTATEQTTTPRKRRSRSRISPEREAELYAAVLDLLREVGYEALTMDAIATRTRCSKATLYRQWTSKPELVAQALRQTKGNVVGDIDTGSLRGDFHELVGQLDDEELRRETALVRGLIHAVHTQPDLLRALRDLIVAPDPTGLEEILRRAVDRGEVRPDCAGLEYVSYVLIGALVARPLVADEPPDRAFLLDYLDAVVLPSLTSRPPSSC
ncbi:TetR/AcrR family transcriptional regulator [Streptomyces sp. S3(2020)]|uniref:TetR/AcrR family transcriptional regulator n=1 Tax=Streptomyces sp. S3(2020) TaxID=2732044 RepID=UPI001487E556|nr:TetR/AcrR family transcriptional regulator [Streptomyces sp. S3(2020)]NNN33198.1 TetR/AcrR family transcriptional regulator [Streptomyces sp. S3(2020)]